MTLIESRDEFIAREMVRRPTSDPIVLRAQFTLGALAMMRRMSAVFSAAGTPQFGPMYDAIQSETRDIAAAMVGELGAAIDPSWLDTNG